jgi:hypothetical protein
MATCPSCQGGWKRWFKSKRLTTSRRIPQHRNKPQVNPQIKRDQLATAALSRQNNWRQQTNPVSKTDRLMVKINNLYKTRGLDPPLGLTSSNVESLKKHLNYLYKSQ